jgi:hypothetical protein
MVKFSKPRQVAYDVQWDDIELVSSTLESEEQTKLANQANTNVTIHSNGNVSVQMAIDEQTLKKNVTNGKLVLNGLPTDMKDVNVKIFIIFV